MDAENAAIKELEDAHAKKPESAKGMIMRFQVFDGYAMYLVTSLRPLKLRHLHYCDGYAIPAAHLRGIGLAEVNAELKGVNARYNFFAKRAAEQEANK